MSDQKCDVCEEDRGPADTCQHCGSKQYRYATDELYADTQSPAAKTGQSDAVARAIRERLEGMEDIGATERRASIDDSSDAWSVDQQADAIDHLEHPLTGPMDTGKKSGRGCLVVFLLFFGIGAIIVVGGIFAIARNSDSLEDFFDELVTEATVDTSPLITEVELESWSEAAVGDCFVENRDASGVFPPTIVDCRVPHDGEFFFVDELPHDDWPGSEVASSIANSLCRDQFEPYIEEAYSESVWYSSALYPNEAHWDTDKSFHCYVYLPDTTSTERAAGSRK